MDSNNLPTVFSIPILPLPQLLDACHAASVAGGWWHDLNSGEKLFRDPLELEMLIISELAEAMEGARKDLMDDKLPHRKMEEVNLADFVIRVCDYVSGKRIPFSIARYHQRIEKYAHLRVPLPAANLRLMVGSVVAGRFENALARATVYAARRGYDLVATINEKMAYNAQRADHKPENRAKENGKKF